MFRFTIRDVLWLMAVVGLGVGWWLQVAKHKQIMRYNDQFRRDGHGQIRIVPYVKDDRGNWGPEVVQ